MPVHNFFLLWCDKVPFQDDSCQRTCIYIKSSALKLYIGINLQIYWVFHTRRQYISTVLWNPHFNPFPSSFFIPPSTTFLHQLHVLSLNNVHWFCIVESLCVHGQRIYSCSMGSLSRVESLKKSDFSSPWSHQLTISPELRVGLHEPLHLLCWEFSWLADLVHAVTTNGNSSVQWANMPSKYCFIKDAHCFLLS